MATINNAKLIELLVKYAGVPVKEAKLISGTDPSPSSITDPVDAATTQAAVISILGHLRGKGELTP